MFPSIVLKCISWEESYTNKIGQIVFGRALFATGVY